MRYFALLEFSLIVSLAYSLKVSYEGYHLIRVFPKNQNHLALLNKFNSDDTKVDIWNEIKGVNHPVDLFVSKDTFFDLKGIFSDYRLKYEVLVNDYQQIIDKEEESMKKNTNNKNIIFRYVRYNEINNFVDEVVDNNPDIATNYVAGKSYEQRDIKVSIINVSPSVPKKAHWIDCGIHAREWVAPATCVYIIDKIIREYRENDPLTVELLNKYEIHVMPLVNPDGYEFTHTSNRLWRKNRTPNPGSVCIGTDLNRNFPFGWMNGGSSTNPCSDTFAGRAVRSEPETNVVISAVEKRTGSWESFFTLHTYGQYWLLPFGFTTPTSDIPENYDELYAKAVIGAEALKSFNGTEFSIGSSGVLLYTSSGSSRDWGYGGQNIKYSYTLELRPGAGTPDASFGFVLPEDRLELASPETWIGIKATLVAIMNDQAK